MENIKYLYSSIPELKKSYIQYDGVLPEGADTYGNVSIAIIDKKLYCIKDERTLILVEKDNWIVASDERIVLTNGEFHGKYNIDDTNNIEKQIKELLEKNIVTKNSNLVEIERAMYYVHRDAYTIPYCKRLSNEKFCLELEVSKPEKYKAISKNLFTYLRDYKSMVKEDLEKFNMKPYYFDDFCSGKVNCPLIIVFEIAKFYKLDTDKFVTPVTNYEELD